MVRTVPLHGDPDGQVFGTVGSLIEMYDGLKYVKISGDSSNFGWKAYNVPPTPTPTPTPTATPTPTPTATPTPTPTPTGGGPTPTPTPTPTGGGPTPTPTPTTFGGVRVLSISPAIGLKTTWDLDVDGPLTVSGYDTWAIDSYNANTFSVNFDINGAAGGNGGNDAFTVGGQGYRGSRVTGSIVISYAYKLIPGAAGSNGITGAGHSTGGAGGLGFFSGGRGGNAGPNGYSGGGGGGGGSSVILGFDDAFYASAGAGGGGGGGGAGLISDGYTAEFSAIPFTEVNGLSGDDKGLDGGGGGGGGAGGGTGGQTREGDVGAFAGTNGGGDYISESTGDGYITLS